MIFTTIRKYQAQEQATDIQCLDEDFESALTLIEIYLQHSIIMFDNLPQQEEQGAFKSGENKKLFYDALPNEFQRKEAIEIGLKFNIKERTADTILKNCLGKFLIKSDTGHYKKI